MLIPDKNAKHPNPLVPQLTFIKNDLTRDSISVGDYTYFDAGNSEISFEECVTHHYDFIGDHLIIGKFCAIASGIEFIMNGCNHRLASVTTYPFNIMGGQWADHAPKLTDLPYKGDTIIGNDVWFGQNVTVLPGITIGNGSIIAANSVVTKDIPPYTVVGGNPARQIKKRFSDEVIQVLEALSWWDWPIDTITKHLDVLTDSNLDLKKLTQLKNEISHG